MLLISQNISKREFLQLLTQHANQSGPLHIQVESLPTFLNTQVSFTIFQYQISNYPRPIVWVTDSAAVREFLLSCSAQVSQLSEVTQLSTVQQQNQELELHSNPISDPVTEAAHLTHPSAETYDFPHFSSHTTESPSSFHPISTQDLFKKTDYQPSALLESTLPAQSQQDLSSWIDKIAATKQALSSLKPSPNLEITKWSPTSAKERTFNWQNLPRTTFWLVGSLGLSMLLVSFLILFPSNVYTLQVQPVTEQTSAALEINQNEFNRRSVQIETQNQVPASGQKEVATERASGQVSLINPAGKDVEITNGSFRLIAENKEYQSLYNSTLPQTIIIPARNNLNGPAIELTIQARQPGSEYNLKENTTFKIVNLLGQNVCSSCYAVSTTEIKNTDLSGEKIVTDADYSILRSTSEATEAEKRLEEIKKVQGDGVVSNTNWFKNNSSEYTFSKQLNEVADSVSLNVKVNSEIFYLTKDQMEGYLQAQNDQIATITDYAIVESQGDFNQPNTPIKIKVFYTYEKRMEIDTSSVAGMLKEKEFEDAKTDIQKNYPSIKNIEKRETGVRMPGLEPRVDVNIVSPENNR